LEHGDATIELLEETDDASREAYWIKELGACNTIQFDGGVHQSKIDPVAYDLAYKAANREKILADSSAYYYANRERELVKSRAYTAANKERINARNAERVPCTICSKILSRTNISRHQKTKSCLESKL